MSPSEMFNREKKAARLAAVLFECGATAEDVMTATPPMWQMCAQAATQKFQEELEDGKVVHPPNSQATVYAVVEQLNRLYAIAADEKAEGKWLDQQMDETGAMRTPGRE